MKNRLFSGQVIPINRDNVDTDLIIPKQYLKSIKKSGFGPFLFDSLRYTETATLDSEENRTENKEFILNNVPYREGKILVSKTNFGCGSSREHAVWAIQNYGIDAVIAESFADIFSRNSFKNGLLLITLQKDIVDDLINSSLRASSFSININLQDANITLPSNDKISFNITDAYKDRIINNLDDIEMTLKYRDEIINYEDTMKIKKPWLFNDG